MQMNVMRHGWFLAIFLLAGSQSMAAEVVVGDSLKDVLVDMGQPRGLIRSGSYLLLDYEHGKVELQDNTVVRTELMTDEELAAYRERTAKRNVAAAKEGYAAVKNEAAKAGRDPDQMFLCNLTTPVCAATRAEAEDKMAVINKLPLEIDALSLLAEALNHDFASKGLDEPLTTEELQGMQGILGIRDGVLKASGKSNPSARDFVTFSGRGQVHDAIVGGPKEIADRLEETFVGRGCDGFVIAATIVPGSYADFVTHIVPELQRRGLFHKDYAGKTLRENLGLKRPAAGAWKTQPRAAAE